MIQVVVKEVAQVLVEDAYANISGEERGDNVVRVIFNRNRGISSDKETFQWD